MTGKPLLGIEIAGYGSALPDKCESNQEFIDRLGLSDATPELIERLSGISFRHLAEGLPDDTAQLAAAAGRAALQKAGVDPSDVDSLMFCTTTPDKSVPPTSAPVSDLLKLKGPAIHDIDAACCGWMVGLNEAYRRIYCGEDKYSLVIGSDVVSRLVSDDPAEWKTTMLFGDGAGAVLLGKNENRPEAGRLGIKETSDASKVDLIHAEHGGPKVMHGTEVYRQATKLMPEVSQAALEDAGIEMDDIKMIFPHQANLRILKSSARKLGVSMDKIAWAGDHHANTSAASIPLTLAEKLDNGEIQRGDNLLLVSFGAGMIAAASVIRY